MNLLGGGTRGEEQRSRKARFSGEMQQVPLIARVNGRREYHSFSSVICDLPEIVNEKTAMFFRQTGKALPRRTVPGHHGCGGIPW